MKKKAKGKTLEGNINKANMRYRINGDALILYKGTPVVITKEGARLEKGPPDFEGILKGGTYICFDAKECGSITSFPLSGIRDHQVTHLQIAGELGGMCFLLIHFYNLHQDHAYKVPIDFILPYWNKWKDEDGRASIPVEDLKDEWLVPIEDYLNGT